MNALVSPLQALVPSEASTDDCLRGPQVQGQARGLWEQEAGEPRAQLTSYSAHSCTCCHLHRGAKARVSRDRDGDKGGKEVTQR